MNKTFVWHCTAESIQQQKISIAACVEIAWSVALYWAIWYWMEFHWHLLSSLVAAPFLLLRSPEAIALSKKWWEGREDREFKLLSLSGLLIVAGLMIISFLLGWFVADVWLTGHEGVALFWRATVVGAFAFAFAVTAVFVVAGTSAVTVAIATGGAIVVAVGVVVAGAVAAAAVFAGAFAAAAAVVATAAIPGRMNSGSNVWIVIGIPIAISIWLITAFMRLLASARFLMAGMSALSGNWRENMFVIDLWRPPGLLPQVEELSGKSILSGFSRGIDGKASAIVVSPFVYIPALFYRWSIKSTFWFYWPILYIRSGQLRDVHDKYSFNQALLKHPLELFRLLLACATLALLAYASLSASRFYDIYATNPAMIFPYLLAVDVSAIKPWQYLQLGTAILTLVLWFKAWTVAIQLKSAERYGKDYDWKPIAFMNAMFRLRNLTTWGYLAIGLVFTLLYWEEIYQYLPETWVLWLADFFDSDVPIRLGSQAELTY